VKASKGSIGGAVDRPDSKIRFYLLLGPDEAQSRALAARLLAASEAAKFAVSAADVKSNPALLADEAAALSLFGERRLIWIEPAGAEILEGAEALLTAPSVESPVVAVAGALPKSSPLLKLAEASPQALAFTAYLPEGDDAARMVSDLGRRVGLKISPPLAARIAEGCANDQAIVAQEVEKLALFVGASPHSPRELDHEAIDALGVDSGDGGVSRLGDLALLGDVAEVAEILSHVSIGGSEAIPAVRSLQRRVLMLAPARARVERGERIDAVLASLGKALFWKEKRAVQTMLAKWTASELARVSERAGELERGLMFSEVPEREALGETFLAIARRARDAREA
jgi:DNA polymerase-3 subunit delta